MYKYFLYLLLIFTYSFSETIDYEKAIIYTINNNKKIKTQKLNIKSSKLDIQKIKASSYGQLNLEHEAMRTNHAGYVFNSKLSSREASFNDFGAMDFINSGMDDSIISNNLNNPEARNNFTTKLSYDIPLFTGFKLQNQEDILKIQHKAQEIKLNLDEKSLEFEVLKAYNGAVVAKEFIKAAKKAKEAAAFFVKTANEFHKEGLVTKIDKKQARVQELIVQSNLTKAQNKFKIALAYLKFLTSRDNISDVKTLKLFKQTNKKFDVLYAKALKQREDLKLMDFQKKGMKKNIELNKASYYPSIYSHLEYGFNDNSINFDSNKDYYMGLIGIKYTLFDNTRSKDLEKSKLQFNKVLLNEKQLKDGIKLELEKALLNLKSKGKIYKEKKEAKRLAFEILEQSKLMYKNQLISMSDLLNQEASYRRNEASLIMAKYEKSLAQGRLNLVLGKSLR